jgi:hypothetical protein
MIKVAVFLEAFTISTVSSEKSSFDMTVGKESFDFCTVVLCCLGSRESKWQDKNCRPSLRPTVLKRIILFPTAEAAVRN